MAKTNRPIAEQIYQLKITLNDSKPPIWRRIQVRADTPLSTLHDIIQDIMPWTNSHLHQFIVGDWRASIFFSDPQFELDNYMVHEPEALQEKLAKLGFDMKLWEEAHDTEPEEAPLFRGLDIGGIGRLDSLFAFLRVMDESRATIQQVVSREGAKFFYEYDFGDGWDHVILLEKILQAEPGKQYPMCLKGKNACPPDDCGGIWGYYGMLEAIQDPKHPEHESMLEWLGGEFDPEAFDLEATNKALRRYAR